MVRTFLKVYMELSSYFLFLQEQIQDIIIISESGSRANLEVRNIRVSEMTDLLIDVTLRHDFIGDGPPGLNQGQLRNPDNPDHILESTAADKIRTYCDQCPRN